MQSDSGAFYKIHVCLFSSSSNWLKWQDTSHEDEMLLHALWVQLSKQLSEKEMFWMTVVEENETHFIFCTLSLSLIAIKLDKSDWTH